MITPAPSRQLKRMLLIGALLISSEVRAQTNLPVLESTELVRVKTRQRQKHVGRVLFSSADSMILTGYNTAIELGSADVRRIDLGMGLTPWKAAEIGGTIGMVAGLAFGIAVLSDSRGEGGAGDIALAFASPIILGGTTLVGWMGGFAAGLGVGLINPTERWQRVYPRPSRMDIIFGNPGRGAGLGLRVAF